MTQTIHNCLSFKLWILLFLMSLMSCNPSVNKEAKAHFDEGVEFYYQYDWDIALDEFNQALAIEPNYVDALYFRGEIYLANDPELAINDFTQIITIDPEYKEAYSSRADAYFLLEENEEFLDLVINDYGMAISLDPTDSYAYFQRALIYSMQGQNELAFAELDAVIELDEDIVDNIERADAYLIRSEIHRDTGDFDQALSDLEQAMQLNPEFDEIYASFYQDLLEKAKRDSQ